VVVFYSNDLALAPTMDIMQSEDPVTVEAVRGLADINFGGEMKCSIIQYF
jgi:hypothetical protein